MKKRKLLQRIKFKIKKLLGFYKLHFKTIKSGCPICGEDLIVCEVAVTCSNYHEIEKIDLSTNTIKYKCNYQIIAG
jgi:hypothetical protein